MRNTASNGGLKFVVSICLLTLMYVYTINSLNLFENISFNYSMAPNKSSSASPDLTFPSLDIGTVSRSGNYYSIRNLMVS